MKKNSGLSKVSDAQTDKEAASALWHNALKETTNPAFFGLYKVKKRYLILMGGAGSGKSIFAGRKILERIVSEANHRVLVVRKVARTLRESCYAQLIGQIAAHYDSSKFKINKTDMVITYSNGSKIIFAGLDDAEKLKSIYNITMIWIEEASEISEADFNQLDIRLRGKTRFYKQITVSFNPININHWLKRRFFDLPQNDEVFTHRSTYRDNVFLDDEAKAVLEAYKETDPYYYSVYCLGEWGVYGSSVFDAQKISLRLSDLKAETIRGEFDFDYDGNRIYNVKFTPDKNGTILIYEPPQKGAPYVMGVDTAGEGSDRSCAQVINNFTGNQAAVMLCEYDEDVFARQLYCLGICYNEAFTGIESNFSTYPIRELERLGYPYQYVRETEDSFTGAVKNAYGFKTNSLTRPLLIAQLKALVRERADTLNDRYTLEEMLTFVRNERGRAEAACGAHDDTVMALGIAHYIRPQQLYRFNEPQEKARYNFSFEEPKPDVLGRGDTLLVV